MPWWIVENTLFAAMLALLVALVSRARRVPPVVRHGLWLVVLIKLIVPPVFSLGISVPGNWVVGRVARQEARDVFEIANRDDGADPPPDLRPGLAGSLTIVGADLEPSGSGSLESPEARDALSSPGWPGLDPLGSPGDEPARSTLTYGPSCEPLRVSQSNSGDSSAARTLHPPGLPKRSSPGHPDTAAQSASCDKPLVPVDDSQPAMLPANLLLCGALAGTLVVALVQVVRLVRLRRMLNRAGRAPEDVAALVADLSSQLGVRPPAVRLSTDISSPLVCALGPAVLLWPASRLASLRESARQAVIVHELAHLARRDHWIGWVELAASCAWWWNPLFWYVRHQLHENAELACDAWVTGLFPEARRDYARALVDLAELDSLETATVPALGVGDGSRKLFERRLVMIMGESVRYRMGALGFIGMGLLALVALPGCSADVTAQEPALSDAPPAQNVGATDEVAGLSEPSIEIEVDDTFTNTPDSLEPRAQPAGTTPPVRTPATRSEDSFDNAAPAAESPRGLPGRGATREQDPAAVSNDDRLKRLEDRFEALLTELRELKSSGRDRAGQTILMAPSGQNATMSAGMMPGTGRGLPPSMGSMSGRGSKTMGGMSGSKNSKGAVRNDGTVEAVSLTRSTYQLPPGKADEIAAFLKENLTDEIEVRVKDELLQVTASAEDQTAIASFLRLLQTRGAAAKPRVPGPAPTTVIPKAF